MNKDEVRRFLQEQAELHKVPFRNILIKWRDDSNKGYQKERARLEKELTKLEKTKKEVEECNRIFDELLDEDWEKIPRAIKGLEDKSS